MRLWAGGSPRISPAASPADRIDNKTVQLGAASVIITVFGVWRSPVAHLLWEQGVQGSNPCTPTNQKNGLSLTTRFSFRNIPESILQYRLPIAQLDRATAF